MEIERDLRYMLEEIDRLNDLIDKVEEAKIERSRLRKKITELMSIYIEKGGGDR